jgi:hypothetical protein
MPYEQALVDEISKIRKVLADLARLMADAEPEQRQKLEKISLDLELAVEGAPNSCTCRRQSARTCSLTGIPVDPL